MLAKILKHLKICFIARILMKIGGISVVHKKACRMMAF